MSGLPDTHGSAMRAVPNVKARANDKWHSGWTVLVQPCAGQKLPPVKVKIRDVDFSATQTRFAICATATAQTVELRLIRASSFRPSWPRALTGFCARDLQGALMR